MENPLFYPEIEKLLEEGVNEKLVGIKLRIYGSYVDSRIVTIIRAKYSCLENQCYLVLYIHNAPSAHLNRVFIPQPPNKYFGIWKAKLGCCQNDDAEVCELYFKNNQYTSGRTIDIEFLQQKIIL